MQSTMAASLIATRDAVQLLSVTAGAVAKLHAISMIRNLHRWQCFGI